MLLQNSPGKLFYRITQASVSSYSEEIFISSLMGFTFHQVNEDSLSFEEIVENHDLPFDISAESQPVGYFLVFRDEEICEDCRESESDELVDDNDNDYNYYDDAGDDEEDPPALVGIFIPDYVDKDAVAHDLKLIFGESSKIADETLLIFHNRLAFDPNRFVDFSKDLRLEIIAEENFLYWADENGDFALSELSALCPN
jgi:hypothetical protein